MHVAHAGWSNADTAALLRQMKSLSSVVSTASSTLSQWWRGPTIADAPSFDVKQAYLLLRDGNHPPLEEEQLLSHTAGA